ncbi:MAG: acetate--CoA ligase family protein [Pseudomonadota bacterium]
MLRPTSIAVVGGGAWCASVIAQAELMGFDGPVWPVHPSAAMVGGHGAFPTVPDLPGVPDAVFVGVNRHATIDVVHELAAMGAGGAVCFASGFAEAAAEDADAGTLQDRLLAAAGDMPILGPNCYGFINALDGALLWPDQHGCVSVDRGVAVLTQSSNIAINLTMQQRALPVAYAVACGNMAQTSQAQIASALLEDPRVTAIGLHVEGFGDIRAWEALAQEAYARRVPLVVLKVGTSELARGATVSHTASLAGSDAGAQALLDRLGIPRVPDLPTLLETLKLLHCHGPLDGRRVASISCSGGEASLMADMADGTGLTFPPLSKTQAAALRDALGPLVALGNPLDYHTYIWRDAARMAAVWAGMTGPGIDMTLSVVDYPVTDASDWTCATQAALQVRADTGRPFALVASLPELMPADTARQLMAGGVVPFCGMAEALAAVEAAARLSAPTAVPVALAGSAGETALLTEAEAKSVLAAYGLAVPRHVICPMAEAKADWDGPSAVKGVGLAHKSEAGAVRLNVDVQDVPMVARGIGTDTVLVEEMIRGTIAELIIGVIRDRVHGFVLTLGAGGVLTEVLRDTVSLLLPVTEDDVRHAVLRLRCAALLQGYRGAPPADMAGITQAVMAVQSYVLEHTDTVSEVEINPLICTPDRAVGVDALIRKA